MRIAVYRAKEYDRAALVAHNAHGHELVFHTERLTAHTAGMAAGAAGVSVFVNDRVDRATLDRLAQLGVRVLGTRSAGYNHIDLSAAREFRITVARVAAYSPNAVSEFTVGLMLTLGRRIHRAYNRVREGNFDLTGLTGIELRDRTIGVLGTGRIGSALVRNLSGFGGRILAYDLEPQAELSGLCDYVAAPTELYRQCDVLSLHVPLTPATRHLIDDQALAQMKDGVFLINTSRGALLDTRAVIRALKSRKLGLLAIDVYEEEEQLFFEDRSNEPIGDDVFERLLTFPNVLVTGHQAFLTDHALRNIAETQLAQFAQYEREARIDGALV